MSYCEGCDEEDCICGPTQDEIVRMRSLYEAEKRAGLLDSREEYRRKMIDAGRGHLLGH